MKTHRLVMPGDLNQYGFLFGGKMISWIDEACWIAASLDYPNCRFVTVGMDHVEFRNGVAEGVILEIDCQKTRVGVTSVSYGVTVNGNDVQSNGPIFSTTVTFVNVDSKGGKLALA
ncbi:MAG: acyl-CoA thioesterase [Akkermansiaceae bacterium]